MTSTSGRHSVLTTYVAKRYFVPNILIIASIALLQVPGFVIPVVSQLRHRESTAKAMHRHPRFGFYKSESDAIESGPPDTLHNAKQKSETLEGAGRGEQMWEFWIWI